MDATSSVNLATNPVSGRSVASIPDPLVNPDLLIPHFDDNKQMFHYVVSRLTRAVGECLVTIEARVVDDMQRKFDVFADMWKHGKISCPIKCIMAKLSTGWSVADWNEEVDS
jgi:hypothetical protein